VAYSDSNENNMQALKQLQLKIDFSQLRQNVDICRGLNEISLKLIFLYCEPIIGKIILYLVIYSASKDANIHFRYSRKRDCVTKLYGHIISNT